MLRRTIACVVGGLAMFACAVTLAPADDVFDSDGGGATSTNGTVTVSASYERTDAGQSNESGWTQTNSGGENTQSQDSGAGCQPIPGQPEDCAWAVTPQGNTGPGINPTAIGIQVATEIQLPLPTPQIGPHPSANKWGLIPVGYPIWLWVDNAPQITSSATRQGLSVSLRAERGPTTFSMGDGTTMQCDTTSPRPAGVTGPVPSPVCGHTYTRVPRTGTTYTITATTTWIVHWTAAATTGQLTLTRTASTQLPVGELQAVIER